MADYTVDKIEYDSNTYVLQDNTSGYYTKSAIVDMFYPIGTIYQTVVSTFNPQTSWGGTWVLLQGAFLVGATNINDSTVYHSDSTTVANSQTYTIPITLDLVTGDTFSILLSTGVRCVYTFGVVSSVNDMVYGGGPSITNNTGSSVTIVECAKGFGSSSTSATTAVGGEATIQLTSDESGVPSHTHPLSGSSGGPSSANTGAGTSHSHTISHAHANGSSTYPNFVTVSDDLSNDTASMLSGSGYKYPYIAAGKSGFSQKAKTGGTDTANSGGESSHTHSMQSHTHTLSSGSASNNTAQEASRGHNNVPPYIPVYTWKRTA